MSSNIQGQSCRGHLWAVVLFLLLAGGGLTAVRAAVFFVAPGGNDAQSGASNAPFATIMRAQQAATLGDTVWLRGGDYFLNDTHLTYTNSPWAVVNRFTKNGIQYRAYPGERPVFDFRAVKPPGYRVTAFLVNASDCSFEGFDVVGVQVTIKVGEASNTQSECFRVDNGNRNRFEQLVMRDGMGIGWYLTRGQSNVVINCDAYNNRGLDSLSMGNVDGFGIHGNSVAHTGNVLRGCRAWFNSDDGFDLINCHAPAVLENCWAFYNGYFTNFTSTGGDANGFKSGGYGVSGATYPTPVPRHVTRFCLAVRNRASGFYANHHPGGLDWINNTAYRNARNFNFLCNVNALGTSNDVPGFDQLLKNNLGYLATVAEVANLGATNDTSFNYFTLPVTVAGNDFMTLDETWLTAPRQADGALPYLAFGQLVKGSDLRDAGTNVGFAYGGSAPDLGAFERGKPPAPMLTLARSGGNLMVAAQGGPAGGTNYLQASGDLSAPGVSWERVATNQFGGAGTFVQQLTIGAEWSGRLYRLELP